MTLSITTTLDPETDLRLRQLAADRGTATDSFLKEAVEQYVEREERRDAFHADARNALAAFRRNGQHLTGEEADEWLDRLAAGEDVDPPACHG